jgi:hypothetical protein
MRSALLLAASMMMSNIVFAKLQDSTIMFAYVLLLGAFLVMDGLELVAKYKE